MTSIFRPASHQTLANKKDQSRGPFVFFPHLATNTIDRVSNMGMDGTMSEAFSKIKTSVNKNN